MIIINIECKGNTSNAEIYSHNQQFDSIIKPYGCKIFVIVHICDNIVVRNINRLEALITRNIIL